ncbi:hypothetical protein [Streptomyces sp. NRRL S-31]|uniref:hypothetical protein n=1 Tax=Streptomyces sp. NRRL S-31 TaxID=1463898 RepID=UPI0004CB17C8|nr:hypothetical protein [Streptomyces sp. NRRL S-31]
MAERGTGPGAGERPVPRDMPDQQTGPGEDPWDVVPGHPSGTERPDEPTAPDPDEAGTAPRGAPGTHTPHPEHPEPEEPSA